jgi:RNA polymerase sigma-70 factor (ECF subfamily)
MGMGATFRAGNTAKLSGRLALGAVMAHRARMVEKDVPDTPPHMPDARVPDLLELRGALTVYFQRRVQEQDDVQDLVQEVFLRLSTRGAETGIDNLRGYVFQVAASILVDRSRRRAARHHDAHVELDPERAGEGDFGPDRILAGREALKAVMAALQHMPERTRTIFVLRRLEGMSYKAIAGRLGLSVSAVEKHMVRAAERLARIGDVR